MKLSTPLCRSALLTLLIVTTILPRHSLAQFPHIKIEGRESNLVYLQKLDMAVMINGSIATTTWTMTFANKTGRVLEGQLDFPLPEGISVSRYALDINGRMREAVPVEKDKGTQVFEAVERRRVDPGLMEKVEGNIFRTRLYPIPANGGRTVLIAYEQELFQGSDRRLHYHLPLAFKNPIENFSLHIEVSRGSSKPVIEDNAGTDLQFGEWENSWSIQKTFTNFRADRSLVIAIPLITGSTEAVMQQTGSRYFFNLSAFPEQKQIARTPPHHITILWDASLSGLSRRLPKEYRLLDDYFARLKDVTVTLVPFSNTTREVHEYKVVGGRWDALKAALQDIVYDGGTQLGAVDPAKYPCDEYLLFSNGHSNFGSHDMPAAPRPVYAILSSANSDFPALRYITARSGGGLINLETVTATQALGQLLFADLYFMGVKPQPGLEDSYPSMPTPVINGISVAGIIDKPVSDIVLQFGYGGKVLSETRVRLDFSRQKNSRLDLTRVWAQKKIAELDTRYEDNKDEIGRLGRRYGIVTRNTSLIVLETVMDYVTYEIEPPAELRKEYDAFIKQRRNDVLVKKIAWDRALEMFNELQSWWLVKHKPGPPKGQKDEYVTMDTAILTNLPPSQVTSAPSTALEGRVAGLDIQRNAGGVPGAYSEVRLRGVASGYYDAYKSSPNTAAANHSNGGGEFKALKADIRTAYLDRLEKASPGDLYKIYLDTRKDNLNTPLFYFNTANFFFGKGRKELGIRILSNIAGLEVESYELYKMMGYELRQAGETRAACAAFKKVLDWRPFEPQSYRDYALALEDAGHYQQALDTLYAALARNYAANIEALYPGIEETILVELNNMVARHEGRLDLARVPKALLRNMPVDIRVVLNWNMNDTDIDLWVTDPNDEKCYYSHKTTALGGRISTDFTRGFGPEQFLLKHAVKGKYKVEVDYYGDTQVKLAGPTTIMVEIYTHYGTPQQTRQLIPLQMQSVDRRTILVGEFDFD